MKLYKSLFIVAAAIAGMMTSCSEDGVWNQASQTDLGLTNGTAYAFNNTSINYTFYPQDEMQGTDIEIVITRGNTKGSVSLPVSAVFSDEELMSGPEMVNFADGANTAIYPIHIDKEFEIGSSATAKLAIDTLSVGIPPVAKPEKLPENATAADSAKFLADSTNYDIYLKKLSEFKLATTVTIEKDYNWVSLGIGQYYDNFTWGTEYYEAEIQQAVENKNWYRVVDPYSKALDDNEITKKDGPTPYIKFQTLQPGDEVRGTTVTQKDLVFFPDFKTGMYLADYSSEVWAIHPSRFTSLAAESNWTFSKVVSYQSDGTPAQVRFAPYYYMFGVGGWNYTQQTGTISIVFPGVKLYYWGAALEYAGLFTNPSNVVYALANYELSGADAKTAKTVKVAVISQDDDAEAVADAIAAGTFEAADLDEVLKDEQIRIQIPEGLSGKLQIILVIIDKAVDGTADEVKNVVAAKFEYYSGADPWKSIGTGYFTDDIFNSYYDYSPLENDCDYEVTIEEHSETKGLYRVKNMFAGVAADFGIEGGEQDIIVHAEDAEGVYIQNQPIGLSHSTHGAMSIQTRGGYLIDVNPDASPSDVIAYFNDAYGTNVFGTEKDGVITFPTLTTKDGKNYQAYLNFADEEYALAGTNGAFKIVLPNASASVKAQAKQRAAAANFERRLYGYAKTYKKVEKRSVKMRKPISVMR